MLTSVLVVPGELAGSAATLFLSVDSDKGFLRLSTVEFYNDELMFVLQSIWIINIDDEKAFSVGYINAVLALSVSRFLLSFFPNGVSIDSLNQGHRDYLHLLAIWMLPQNVLFLPIWSGSGICFCFGNKRFCQGCYSKEHL